MADNRQPYEFLWVIKESAYLTQKGTPTAGTDSIYIRLDGANRFTLRPMPTQRAVAFGGGFAVQGYTVSDKMAVGVGQLAVTLCYSQAKLLLDWACTRINAGQTTPWTTTEPPGDLASCTVYHGVMRDDGTIRRRRYKGVKVHNWRLASSADSGLTTLTMGVLAAKMDSNAVDSSSDPDATAFPAPADTAFPTDPLLFVETNGGISVGGSTVLYCQGIDLNVTNAMATRTWNNRFVQVDRIRGRKSTLTAQVLYTASPSWRALYEALTTRAASFAWTNGVNTVTLDYKSNNIISGVEDQLQPGDLYDQAVTLESQYDTSAGTDLAFTFA